MVTTLCHYAKYELPPGVRATTDAAVALDDADFIVHAVPVQSSKKFLASVKDHIHPETPLLCLAKGLEVGSCEMMSEVIPAGLGREQPLAVLSGGGVVQAEFVFTRSFKRRLVSSC